jgi:hypothetical protein
VTTGPSALPLTGVQLPIPVAGDGDRRVVAAVGSRAVQIAVSTDAGNSFGPPIAVPRSVDVIGWVAVSVDPQGLGAAAWLDRSPSGGPSRVLATVVGATASASAPAVVLDTAPTAPAPPLVAAQSDGALVGWTVTQRRAPLADGSPGVMRLARIGAAGVPEAIPVTLGGAGEQGRLVGLVPRQGDRAQAFWVTPSRALRSQVIGVSGRPGPAVTLDRGVDPRSVQVAGSSTSPTAVTWTSRGRLRLASKPR